MPMIETKLNAFFVFVGKGIKVEKKDFKGHFRHFVFWKEHFDEHLAHLSGSMIRGTEKITWNIYQK